mgnify:CR=1 FL=1
MDIILEPYSYGDSWNDDSDYEHKETQVEYDRKVKITGFRRKTEEEYAKESDSET